MNTIYHLKEVSSGYVEPGGHPHSGPGYLDPLRREIPDSGFRRELHRELRSLLSGNL